MCGIVGAASGFLSPGEIECFEDLMIVSNLRGKTGAGTIVVNRGGKGYRVHGVKSLGTGIDVCRMERYRKEARGEPTTVALIGHTRHPTKGAHVIENVHPHMLPNLAGVHNGTMFRVGGQPIPEGQSDSRLLYEHIDTMGIRNALKDSSGAYALVFLDYLDGTLNFIRNGQRPLFFAKVAWRGMRTLFWASEAEFLELVLSRNKVRYELEMLPTDELWTIPADLREDFDVYKNVRSGINAWNNTSSSSSSSSAKKEEKEESSVADSVPFSKTDSKRFVTLPTSVGPELSKLPASRTGEKETYVCQNGVVVLKGHANKQVSLPRTDETAGNEQEGNKTADDLVGEAQRRRSEHLEEREKADVQIQSRKKSGLPAVSHLRVVAQQPPLSPEEQAFNAEMDEAIRWRQNVDENFNKLMAERYPDNDQTAETPIDDPVDDLFDQAFGSKANDHSMLETEKGTYFLRSRVEKICMDGCAYCGDSVDYSKDLAWLDREQFLCEPCQGDKVALTMMFDFYPYSKIMEDWRDGKLKGVGKPPVAAWMDTESGTDKRTLN